MDPKKRRNVVTVLEDLNGDEVSSIERTNYCNCTFSHFVRERVKSTILLDELFLVFIAGILIRR